MSGAVFSLVIAALLLAEPGIAAEVLEEAVERVVLRQIREAGERRIVAFELGRADLALDADGNNRGGDLLHDVREADGLRAVHANGLGEGRSGDRGVDAGEGEDGCEAGAGEGEPAGGA